MPKANKHEGQFIDEYQESKSSSSSSSEDSDGRHGDREGNHDDDDDRHGCWFKYRRNDYIYIDVTK